MKEYKKVKSFLENIKKFEGYKDAMKLVKKTEKHGKLVYYTNYVPLISFMYLSVRRNITKRIKE